MSVSGSRRGGFSEALRLMGVAVTNRAGSEDAAACQPARPYAARAI